MKTLIMALLSVFLTGAAAWDINTGKIPNRWIIFGIAGFVIAKLLEVSQTDWVDLVAVTAYFLIRIILFAALFFMLFLFRMIGAGDIKVMALIGGYLGFLNGFQVIFFGLAASAAWSLFQMIHKRIFMKRIRYFVTYLYKFIQTGRITPYYREKRDGREAAFYFVPFLWLGFILWMAGLGKGGVI